MFRRSENSILEKLTRFCLFKQIFKIFSKFQKSETSNLLQLNFSGYHKYTLIILARKITLFFGVFWTQLFWGSKKHQKRDFTSKYDQFDDCGTPKSSVPITLMFLIFEILKES